MLEREEREREGGSVEGDVPLGRVLLGRHPSKGNLVGFFGDFKIRNINLMSLQCPAKFAVPDRFRKPGRFGYIPDCEIKQGVKRKYVDTSRREGPRLYSRTVWRVRVAGARPRASSLA